MALLWSTPRTWVTRDPITKTKLNAISNQLNYLYAPSVGVQTVRGTGVNATITGASPVAIDDGLLAISLETSGRFLTCHLTGVASHATLAAFMMFDVLIDGTTYLSSLTGTQLAQGVSRFRQYVAAYEVPVNWKAYIPAGVLSAGVHTFAPRSWVSAGTGTFYLATGYFAQFYVGEQ
jgi:hypothetical protein